MRAGTVDDLSLLYRMFAETSVRDGFKLREEGYYQFIWRSFMNVSPSVFCLQPFMEPLIAEVDGDPVAAGTNFYFADQALCSLRNEARDPLREKTKLPALLGS